MKALITTLTFAAGLLGFEFTNAIGQVVQQPAFRNFSYTGGAWVPDQGTGTFGGATYGQSSSVGRGFGPYAPRGRGGGMGASSLTASVTIIDLDALDQAMLTSPSTPSAPRSSAPRSSASSSASTVGPLAPAGSNTSADSGMPPVRRIVGDQRKVINASESFRVDRGIVASDPNAYVRALHGHDPRLKTAAIPSQVEEDVRYFLTEGQKAEAAGRIIAARVYYRMAMEAMPPELLARYQRIMQERAEEKQQAASETTRPGSLRF